MPPRPVFLVCFRFTCQAYDLPSQARQKVLCRKLSDGRVISHELWTPELSCTGPRGGRFCPLHFPSGPWLDPLCRLPHGLRKTGLVPEVEMTNSVSLLWSRMQFLCRCDLVVQSFCWEAELVKDCRPNGEMISTVSCCAWWDVTRLTALQHSSKETIVCLFLEKSLVCSTVLPLLHVGEPLTSLWREVSRERQLEKSANGGLHLAAELALNLDFSGRYRSRT